MSDSRTVELGASLIARTDSEQRAILARAGHPRVAYAHIVCSPCASRHCLMIGNHWVAKAEGGGTWVCQHCFDGMMGRKPPGPIRVTVAVIIRRARVRSGHHAHRAVNQ